MREIKYERLGEAIYEEQLDNGLTVFVVPKFDFRQTYASFTTKYGSIDSEFVLPSKGERIRVPDGIAHFLEHKMFEEEHGDVFMDFAKLGAQANAFTTFDTTTYLFSSTNHELENLGILVDFVQRPYFTDANVEKEKGIIGQEIKMYEDNPNWRVYFGLLKALYGKFPVAIDIAGTVESIAKITKEDLYDCYNTFYHPSNMVLFVIGPVDPATVMSFVQENQAKKSYQGQPPVARFLPQLPAHPDQRKVEAHLSLSQPRILFGFKETLITPDADIRHRHEAAMEIWMDGILGKGSDLYYSLIDEGLTDMGFGSDYELTSWYGHSMIGGNSDKPMELAERVKSALFEAARIGMPEVDFVRTKKKAIGRFMALLDSPQGIANVYTSQKLRGIDLFTYLSVLEETTLDDVNRAIKMHVKDDQFAMSVVWPLSDAGAAEVGEGIAEKGQDGTN